MYDVIIIGAGMSGIAAGIRLAYYDKKVCILEKHSRPGGLNSFYNIDGRKFDVGLHAMTNYVPKSDKKAPLSKLIRQLKLRYDDFALCEQKVSSIKFPQMELNFSNDFAMLEQEVAEKFPKQEDNFRRLCEHISQFNEVNLYSTATSAREVVSSFISDPLLVEMIFCPLSYYGSATENDMDFYQFVIMFKSIFYEGFARPEEGVRLIINLLLKKYKSSGGELRFKTGVKSIDTKSGQSGQKEVCSVTLENGEVLEAKKIMSSIGYVETMGLTGEKASSDNADRVGKLSFVEMIYMLDKTPNALDIEKTITFYSDSEKFSYHKPEKLVDFSSGVICCPNNFQFENPLSENMIRVTHMANYDLWSRLSAEEYQEQKKACMKESLKKICTQIPDFSSCINFTDMFTPVTIKRFTGHLGGAVYGSPHKIKDGRTAINNLFICGTDQGFMGIIGAMLSGISMANLHALR